MLIFFVKEIDRLAIRGLAAREDAASLVLVMRVVCVMVRDSFSVSREREGILRTQHALKRSPCLI